jgi:murein L,D-transpeptidase YcbB/YkuD
MFPNKHDVYMHDTPQKHLFANQVRAESHGCMRVQNPDQLAAVIMEHDKGWSHARTQSSMDTAYDQHVALGRPIPVYITYFTLKVNEDGSITNYRDLYGHDSRMSAALLRGPTRVAGQDDQIVTPSIQQRQRTRGGNPFEEMLSSF